MSKYGISQRVSILITRTLAFSTFQFLKVPILRAGGGKKGREREIDIRVASATRIDATRPRLLLRGRKDIYVVRKFTEQFHRSVPALMWLRSAREHFTKHKRYAQKDKKFSL